ncbi:carboxylesterase [Intrasporangium oryzae NRRL B-24470]|uniref:Carboxylic ester hydrolase n=1 Tax=Intrasporangium oryzae NRRL B-24470 TaxID=1386089 RepID=W9G654_9MICO|nr:carboxylesterase family protein [Intrasporangium oryzae]EWT00283.1 carboxylesterase [Intrasporangium oryzae NRRL B-24470]
MDTVVRIAQGELLGRVAEGVHAFLGVPYAAPPVGANRLRPPRPPEPWSGVRDATQLGPEPPQVAPPSTGGPREGASEDWKTVGSAFEKVERAAPSEDCLNLNIWTPDPGADGLPVMVWVQGGMFELSSTAAYDGSHFARDGVVCVVINWRPGAEGFLYLADGVANLGLLDQVAALEWVRDTIAAFGGDPGNVTVFGESAGAMSIGMLLAMPRARGLFRRAILQSGAAHQVTPADDALRVAGHLADRLGVPRTREAIAAVGVERLLAAQAELKAELLTDPDPERWGQAVVTSTMPWQPVIDGEVLPGPPIDLVASGSAGEVEVMVGTNTDDWRLWLVVSGAIGRVTDEILTGPVRSYGYQSLAAYGLAPEAALAAYRARYAGASPGDLLTRVQTDWWMRIPAIRLADAHADRHGVSHGEAGASDRARTYMYEFAWPSPGLGAVHALEVPFVFDTVRTDAPLFGPLLGSDPPQELARTMHAAWVAFATHGDPGWPAYDLTRRATMRFDTTSHVVDDPRSWERAFWDGVR